MDNNHVFGARMLTPLLFSKLLVITAFSGEVDRCCLLSFWIPVTLLLRCCIACFDDRDYALLPPELAWWSTDRCGYFRVGPFDFSA